MGGMEPEEDLREPLLTSSSQTAPNQPQHCSSSSVSAGHLITVDAETGEDEAAEPRPIRMGTSWLLVTAIMLSDMFGLGTLSLPADFARLGWAPALACTLLFAAGDVYTGSLYQRLSLAVPGAKVFDQIGQAACGKLGKILVFCTIYLTILGEPIIFHLTTVESLKQMFYQSQMSSLTASMIVTVLILPLAQIHHMEDVAWVSIFGTLGMMLACAVVVVKLVVLFLQGGVPEAKTEVVADISWQAAFVGLMDIAFAFGGQVNWMRYITTMQKRQHFSRAVSLTTMFMTVFYLVVSVVGYAVYGNTVDLHKPITSVLSQDGWFIVMNFGIFLHCVIGYQVNVNVWCASLLHILMPKYNEDASRATPQGRAAHRLLWFLTTTACIGISALVSYVLPFFTILMSIIASLGDLMSMFGLPCLFALRLLRLSRGEAVTCGVLAVAATTLSLCGVVSSVWQLVEAVTGSSNKLHKAAFKPG